MMGALLFLFASFLSNESRYVTTLEFILLIQYASMHVTTSTDMLLDQIPNRKASNHRSRALHQIHVIL